jgi:hypothetical protein
MGSVVEGWGTSPAEQQRAADCLQRPLRSRFRQQLTPSVRLQKKKFGMNPTQGDDYAV